MLDKICFVDTLHRNVTLLVAAAVGTAFALTIFPLDLLCGFPRYWNRVQGDNAANWIGYVAFAQDVWRWPIFRTELLMPPEGVNILFTDPIPILALLGKIIFKSTGCLLNYFGPWLLLAYTLQPVCGYLLLRNLRLTESAALAGGMLFLLFPVFIFRYGHFPLLAHWLLLAAFIFYFLITETGAIRYLNLGAAATLLLVLVNPYLFVMATAIYFAALGDAVLYKKINLPVACLAAIAVITTALGATILFGFINPGKPVISGWGFGFFSMNLLSPFVPSRLPWDEIKFREGYNYLNAWDATGGQFFEGYNYLGGGVLVLLALALTSAWHAIWIFVRRHALLFLTTFGLGVYALSTRIFAGNLLIAVLPLENFEPFTTITGVFRASGRFFWPLGYLLLTTAVYAIFLRFGQKRFVVIVLAVILVQAVDVRPLILDVVARAKTKQERIDFRKWTETIQAYDELLILPPFLCAATSEQPFILSLGVAVAELGKPTNSAFVNRSAVDCNVEKRAFSRNLRARATLPNPLVVAFKEQLSANAIYLENARSGLACRDAGFAYVCSANSLQLTISTLGTEFAPPPTIKLGEMISTNANDVGIEFLGAGWSDTTEAGVWGTGPESNILANFSDVICGDLILRATVVPFAAGDHFVKNADVWVNGRMISTLWINAPGEQDVTLRIPNQGCSKFLDVVFKFSELKSPQQLGLSEDPRLLSWLLRSFSFKKID
jgi:hypothetical protein